MKIDDWFPKFTIMKRRTKKINQYLNRSVPVFDISPLNYDRVVENVSDKDNIQSYFWAVGNDIRKAMTKMGKDKIVEKQFTEQE